jgi:prepilin-type N-terminal cleavage/methylation domain-containing protein
MLYRLRQRSSDQSGFTLIELLVVILIIGILAAIAIPSLLSQKSKAYDAGAKELARTGYTTMETYATDHSGSYEGAEIKILHEYEPSIPTSEAAANGGATLTVNKATATEFEVTGVEANTKDEFKLLRNASGEVTRTCKPGVSTQKTGCETGSW